MAGQSGDVAGIVDQLVDEVLIEGHVALHHAQQQPLIERQHIQQRDRHNNCRDQPADVKAGIGWG